MLTILSWPRYIFLYVFLIGGKCRLPPPISNHPFCFSSVIVKGCDVKTLQRHKGWCKNVIHGDSLLTTQQTGWGGFGE